MQLANFKSRLPERYGPIAGRTDSATLKRVRQRRAQTGIHCRLTRMLSLLYCATADWLAGLAGYRAEVSRRADGQPVRSSTATTGRTEHTCRSACPCSFLPSRRAGAATAGAPELESVECAGQDGRGKARKASPNGRSQRRQGHDDCHDDWPGLPGCQSAPLKRR